MKISHIFKEALRGMLSHVRISLLVLSSFCAPLPGFCQFYPQPKAISKTRLSHLIKQLNSISDDSKRMEILFSISNIYCFRTIDNDKDIKLGLRYCRTAQTLAIKLKDKEGLNTASLLLANLYAKLDELGNAELLLNNVNGQAKPDLLLLLGFGYSVTEKGIASVNKERAKRYLDEATALAKQHGDLSTLIGARRISGILHTTKGEFTLAEKDLNAALAQAKAKSSKALPYLDMDFCLLHMSKGNYDKALRYGLSALDAASKARDTTALGDANLLVGIVFRNTGELKKATNHFQLATDSYKVIRGSLGTITESIKNTGQVMVSEKRYQDALNYFKENFRKYPAVNFEGRQAELGSIGDCYLKLGQFRLAESYFLREFRNASQAGSLNESAYHRVAFFYVESSNFAKALPYLKKALGYVESIPVQTRGHLYYMLYMAESSLGNYRDATAYLLENKKCDQIIYKESKVRDLQELTVKYETEKKTQQIDLLKKTQELQRMELGHAKLVGKLGIGAVLLFLIIGLAFYLQYRKRLKLAVTIDIKNAQLEDLVEEKEWLLKEVHHRVKNNLHTIISLLNIQSEFLEGDALQAIENSQNRIYAMSLIHKKLYLSEGSDLINLEAYLNELVDYLKESFGPEPEIYYSLDIDPLNVDIAKAIPLGLILNEAVSNSIKHAFVGRKQNRITISLKNDAGELILEIADNGTGMPIDAVPTRPDALGLRLIRGLAKEIGGRVEMYGSGGTCIRIKLNLVETKN